MQLLGFSIALILSSLLQEKRKKKEINHVPQKDHFLPLVFIRRTSNKHITTHKKTLIFLVYSIGNFKN
jgi:hypothetical protein